MGRLAPGTHACGVAANIRQFGADEGRAELRAQGFQALCRTEFVALKAGR
jgi:hypothetical protein